MRSSPARATPRLTVPPDWALRGSHTVGSAASARGAGPDTLHKIASQAGGASGWGRRCVRWTRGGQLPGAELLFQGCPALVKRFPSIKGDGVGRLSLSRSHAASRGAEMKKGNGPTGASQDLRQGRQGRACVCSVRCGSCWPRVAGVDEALSFHSDLMT